MPEIVQKSDPILRAQAKTVSAEEIGSDKIAAIIADMKTALSGQKDGIAIAAPQIGVSLRIFVIAGKLLSEADHSYKGPQEDLIFINPEITKMSKEKVAVEEGCLSVRWLYGIVDRSTRVTLKAVNERGERVERGAKGLLAQIFQHEVDHLHGRLFTDTASDVWEMSEEEIKELQGK